MGLAREEAEIKQILLPELDQKLQDGLRWFFETLVESARWMRAAWRARTHTGCVHQDCEPLQPGA